MNPVAASRFTVDEKSDLSPTEIADAVAAIARRELAPLAGAIDGGSVYPAELLRRFGDAGAWGSHRPDNGAADLGGAIASMAAIGEVCGATAFMAWCQNTLAWYAFNSPNPALAGFADDVAAGRVLGGTGLSNPMKSFFGIEKLKLRGRRVEGGYVVRGALPWVSNLGPDHFFGTIFEVEDRAGRDRDVSRRLLRPRDHAAAVQAVPGDGRHRHLWRAVPRRLRSRRPDPGGASRPFREEDPRRIHPVAGRHGDRPDPGLHRDHEGSRRLARPRQPFPAATADRLP